MNGSISLPPPNSDCIIIHDLNRTIESSAVSSVLELVVLITNSASAHLYWVDSATNELRLVSASSASEDCRIHRVSLQFSATTEPAILRAGDPGYDSFPETAISQVSSLLVSPIRAEEKLAGILTLSRKDSRRYGTADIGTAAKAADALAAAMRELEREREVDSLRAKLRSAHRKNTLLEKRLAERKLVERAKGLLQVHYEWTEEDAYYHLRRTSRQQRTPMAVIAQMVIDVIAAKEAEGERMSA
jgi:GAF domain-containing protein